MLADELPRIVDDDIRRVSHEVVVPVTSERADVMAVGDLMWFFEIKSGRDSLRRLNRQVDAFGRVADRCVLVAASRHIGDAELQIPLWWGIVEVMEGAEVRLRKHRAAAPNPARDRRSLLLMLRRAEAEATLASLDGRCRPGRRRMSMLAELDRHLDNEEVACCVRAALLRRTAGLTPMAG